MLRHSPWSTGCAKCSAPAGISRWGNEMSCAKVHHAVLAAVAVTLFAQPSRADEAAARAFYQGKQIRFFTMGSPGGGYDTYTRTVATFLERKLGAKLLPTNEPSAGGMIGMN